jgi:TatD DNase family protein
VVDSHCHLDASDPATEQALAGAREAGVRRFGVVGTDRDSCDGALRLAQGADDVFAIVGLHPHNTTGFGDDQGVWLGDRARGRGVVAVGETGLDYYRDNAPRDDQRRSFEWHIELARALGLPLVIHTRAAEDDTLDVLGAHAEGLTVIMHCFSMPDRLAECVERGYMCSFAGNVTYGSAEDLREAARDVPAELLLVETDSPYLAPKPVRGKPNQPANVVHTARLVAEVRGLEYEELERTVEQNAARVFGW